MRNFRIYSYNLITKRQITQLKNWQRVQIDILLGRPTGTWKDAQHYLSLSESEVAQSSPTLCDPMDCSLPGSSIQGIFPGNSTGFSFYFLLQGIFPTQGLNPGLLHCRQTLYHLSHQGRPNGLSKCKWKQQWDITSYPSGWLLSKPQETTESMRMWRSWNPCALLVGI